MTWRSEVDEARCGCGASWSDCAVGPPRAVDSWLLEPLETGLAWSKFGETQSGCGAGSPSSVLAEPPQSLLEELEMGIVTWASFVEAFKSVVFGNAVTWSGSIRCSTAATPAAAAGSRSSRIPFKWLVGLPLHQQQGFFLGPCGGAFLVFVTVSCCCARHQQLHRTTQFGGLFGGFRQEGGQQFSTRLRDPKHWLCE
mgnify:CR=1 FL=1